MKDCNHNNKVFKMSVENSIELFNCPLCSFCETSLDRLACHIRNHIKPEPCSQDDSSVISPRDQNRNCADGLTKQDGDGFLGDVVTKKTHDRPGDVLASTIDQLSNASQNTSSSDSNTSLPRIEVTNPRTLVQSAVLYHDANGMKQYPTAIHQHPVSTALHIASTKSLQYTFKHQPKMPEKAHYTRANNSNNNGSNAKTFMASSPSSDAIVMQPNDGMSFTPGQGRERPFMIKQPHNSSNQQINIHKPEYFSIAPAKTMYQETPVPMETVDYRRNAPIGERNSTIAMQNVSYAPSLQRNMSQISPTGEVHMRPFELGTGYQEYRYASPSHHQQIHTVYTPPQISQNYPHVLPQQQRPGLQSMVYRQQQHHHQQQQQKQQQHQPQLRHQQQPQNQKQHLQHQQQQQQQQQKKQLQKHVKTTFTMEKKQSVSQLHSQINGIHLSEVKKQSTIQNMSIPNTGTVMLNPEQVLAALTSSISKEQLAGLLIVPLKKTSEIGVQTDPVEIEDFSKPHLNGNISCGVQTELRMHQISEEHSKMSVPVFDSIRSTDGLSECLVCGEEFASDYHLQEHVNENHNHVCDNCFHASTNLTEHQQHVSECGKYEAEMLCMDCNSSFSSIKKLNQHRIKVHAVRMPFRCGICSVPFETHDAVMSHMTTHSDEVSNFKCRYCTKVFQCAEALSIHVDRHKGVDVEYECRFCKKSFSSDKLLRDHIGFAHVITESPERNNMKFQPQKVTTKDVSRPDMSSSLNNTTITTSNRKYSLCLNCDLAFKNKELLARHLGACSKNPQLEISQFTCDVCKEFFSNDLLRRQHIKKDHRRANGYRCPKCSKIYRTWSRLKFHTKQQHLRKICTDCNTVFTKDHVLRKHQEDVHGKSERQQGDRVYTCSLCNAMMYTLTGLMNHRRDVHPELKAMKTADQSSSATMLSFIDDPLNSESNDDLSVLNCPHCNEIFTSSSLLNNHIKVRHPAANNNNDGPAPTASRVTCHKCGATFEDEKRMKNHLGLTHGERPFVCDTCNKRFQYSSQIAWHMKNNHKQGTLKSSLKLWQVKGKLNKLKIKTQTSNLPYYLCHFCGARFRQEKLLKNHKGTVHKIKLFSCDICSAKFGHSTELIWHVRTCKAKFFRQNPGVDLPTPEKVSPSNGNASEENGTADTNDIDPEFISGTPLEDDVDEFRSTSHVHLSKEEGEELLNNNPEYDLGRGEYICPVCQKTTKSITGMKTHYGRVHGVWGKETSHKIDEKSVTIWPCQNCDQEYRSFEEISSHSLNQHGISVVKEEIDCETRQEFISGKPINIIYTCPHCGISFDNTKSIRVHAFKKHGILINDVELNQQWRKEKGASPTKPIIDTNANASDNALHGDINNTATTEEPRFKCPRCTAKYRSTKALRVHSYKRHGVILSKNELQNSQESLDDVSSALKANTKSSKGHDLVESRNPCDKCGRIFGNYRALFTHYRQAHGMTGVKNLIPRKPSRTELSLESSTMTSPNNTQFSSQSNNDGNNNATPTNATSRHSVTTVDSVDCPKCQRIFTYHKSLVAHLFSAHGISKDKYPNYWPNGMPVLPREMSTCPTCNKECVDERAMRIHMFKAHGKHYRDYEQSQTQANQESSVASEPISCCVCNELFRTQRALIAHEYRHHGIKWIALQRIFPQDSEVSGMNEESATMVDRREMIPSSEVAVEAMNKTPKSGFLQCPKCVATYRNRRAMTTHLCRVHRYKKLDIHLYFSKQLSGVAVSNANNTITSPMLEDASSVTNDPDVPNGGMVKTDSEKVANKFEMLQEHNGDNKKIEDLEMIMPREVNGSPPPVQESKVSEENFETDLSADEEDQLVIDQASNTDVEFDEKNNVVDEMEHAVMSLIPDENENAVKDVIPVPIIA